jgi:hypothetical protein
MSTSQSPRLKLRRESDSELIDQFATNWPILDKFAGGIVTAPGVTPPDSELFHGCIVREGNGKSWIAVKNPISGVYTKQWLTYEWSCSATASVSVGSSGPNGFNLIPLTAIDPARCVNSDISALSGGQIMCPINGIYQAQIHTRWPFPDHGEWYKSAAIMLNNVSATQNWNCDIRRKNESIVTNNTAQIFQATATPYPVGALIAMLCDGARDVEIDMTLTLLSPL